MAPVQVGGAAIEAVPREFLFEGPGRQVHMGLAGDGAFAQGEEVHLMGQAHGEIREGPPKVYPGKKNLAIPFKLVFLQW